MSIKHEEIDLNADAVSGDRENEVDIHVIVGSVGETLTEPITDQGEVQSSEVDKVRVCDSAEVICDLNIGGNDVNMDSEGVDRDVDVLDKEVNVEKGNEHLDRGVDAKVKENKAKFGDDASPRWENEVEGAPVVKRASREGEIDHDRNVGPFGEVLELDNDDRGTIESLRQKFEAATSDGLGNDAMEIETPTKLDVNEDQLVDVHVSEVRDSSDVLNESYAVNLVVDLDPYTIADRKGSSNANAKLVISQPELCAGDLVWGKVRSHPWWPGQIFDPSTASQKARKYFKRESYLIAYFGDQTFAWNEESKLKPFREHFAQMEKQTSLEDFHYAVDCTLEEVSRRLEFGLTCSCIPEEAYARIKNQMIVNAGIRKESSTIDGGDSFSNAASFEPVKLSEKIKTLAQLPYYSEVDRLEFVVLKAQLSAFYRWKGYLVLPEFNVLGGLPDSDAEIPHSGEVKQGAEVPQRYDPNFVVDKQVSSKTGKLKSQNGSSLKRKHISGNSIHPSKKEKSLIDFLTENANMSNGKQQTDGKGDELISSSSGKKRKSFDSISNDIAVKHKKLDSISDDGTAKEKKCDMLADKYEKGDLSVVAANKCVPIKKTFGVGNSILKVAGQLNGSSQIFKSGDGILQKTMVKNKSKDKSIFRNSLSEKLFPSEGSSPDGLLSQLCMAARDPMEGYNFLLSAVSFFLEFRNSVSGEQSHKEASGDKIRKAWTNSEATEISESEPRIQDNPEEQQALENKNEAGELLHETPSSPVGPTSAVQLSSHLESVLQTAGENFEEETGKPADPFNGCCGEDPSPTALILNFSDLDSVPSKENLNKIFSHYGSLNELETEVLKSKRAKVVFKRRADAEAAFSSAGKYRIFGPSLVSYCLKYMPSKSSKSPSQAAKRGKKATKSERLNST